jgi:hypothetical protein
VVVVGKIPNLGNNCSCIESIDIFSQFEDLVLMEIWRWETIEQRTADMDCGYGQEERLLLGLLDFSERALRIGIGI